MILNYTIQIMLQLYHMLLNWLFCCFEFNEYFFDPKILNAVFVLVYQNSISAMSLPVSGLKNQMLLCTHRSHIKYSCHTTSSSGQLSLGDVLNGCF